MDMKGIPTRALEGELRRTLNEIVKRHPSALAVFDRLGLDACCGGEQPLADAALAHGLDPLEVLEALAPSLRAEAPATGAGGCGCGCACAGDG